MTRTLVTGAAPSCGDEVAPAGSSGAAATWGDRTVPMRAKRGPANKHEERG
jgi:hypothetical protein